MKKSFTVYKTKNMNQLQQDLKFGKKKEEDLLTIFRAFFGANLRKQPKYSLFDFICAQTKIYLELKSRRVKKNQYPSTMIGYNKITEGLKKIEEGNKVFLLFDFTDALCYYELDSKTFSNNWVRSGGRFDRGRPEISKYAYIPSSELKYIYVKPLSLLRQIVEHKPLAYPKPQ